MSLKSAFDKPACPTPSGASDLGGTSGGFSLPSGPGPLQSPFDKAVVPMDAGGGSETPNSLSGLPTQVTTVTLEGQTTPDLLPSLMDVPKISGR